MFFGFFDLPLNDLQIYNKWIQMKTVIWHWVINLYDVVLMQEVHLSSFLKGQFSYHLNLFKYNSFCSVQNESG